MTLSACARSGLLAAALSAGAMSSAAADPIALTDLTGRHLTLAGPAARIVVLPIPSTSTVIALDGGTDRLVGMNPESKLAIEEGILGDFFPAAKDITSDILASGASRGFAPNVEAIAALKPDLIIQWGDIGDDAVAPLTNAGFSTALLLYGTEQYARDTIALIGTALDRPEKLAMLTAWRDQTERAIAEGTASLDEADRPKVAYFFYTTPDLQTEGTGTFTDWQIALAGGTNAAAEIKGWKPVSVEQVAAWNPDVILLGAFEKGLHVDRIYHDPILGETNAARTRRVYKVPMGGYRWDPPSQESPLTWMWLADLLHPDRFHFDLRRAIAEWYPKIYGQAPTPRQIDAILNLEMNGGGANYGQFAAR